MVWSECPDCQGWTVRRSAEDHCRLCGSTAPPSAVAPMDRPLGVAFKVARPFEIWVQAKPDWPWWRTLGTFEYESHAMRDLEETLRVTKAARAAAVNVKTRTFLRIVSAKGVPPLTPDQAAKIPLDREALVSRFVPLPAVEQSPVQAQKYEQGGSAGEPRPVTPTLVPAPYPPASRRRR